MTKRAPKPKAKPRRKRRGRGQPTALTPEVRRIICRELAASSTMSMAAGAAGISYDTLREWIARGTGTDTDRPSSELYAAFAVAVEAAVAEGKRKRIRTITKSKDWRAHAWMLERGHAAEFGRIDRIKAETSIGGDDTKPPIRTADMTDEEIRKVLGILNKGRDPDDT